MVWILNYGRVILIRGRLIENERGESWCVLSYHFFPYIMNEYDSNWKIDGLKNKKTSSIGFFVLFLILCNRITKTQQYGSIIHNRKVQKESVEKTKKIDKK